jgi:hypothetical protein
VSAHPDDPGQRRKLVQYALDLDGRDRRPLDRREEHPAQGIADGRAEPALEGLGIELTVRRRQRLGVDLEPLGFLKAFPQGHV